MPRDASASSTLPLEGVRVLAIENYIAGPLATSLLADWGADVVKIEAPSGDAYRSFPPVEARDGMHSNPSFARINRSKRSIVLDLSLADGRNDFLEYVEVADIVLQNLRPGALAKLGIGFEKLKERNPNVILVSVSGFGQPDVLDGPFRTLPAFDIVGQAMSGLGFAGGGEDTPPQQLGVPVVDTATADWAATASLLGLLYRDRIGSAVHLDISMLDVAMHINEYRLGHYAYFNEQVPRGAVSTSAPFDYFAAGDGSFALAISGENSWLAFCRAIGMDAWLEDGSLQNGSDRYREMGRLRPVIENWAQSRTVAEVLAILKEHGVPAAAARDEEAVLGCVHAQARGAWIDVPDPVLGRVRVVGNPVKANTFGARPPSAPPQLGADRAQVTAHWLSGD